MEFLTSTSFNRTGDGKLPMKSVLDGGTISGGGREAYDELEGRCDAGGIGGGG